MIVFIFLYTNNPKADELLIYADNSSYDVDEILLQKEMLKLLKQMKLLHLI